MEKLDINLHDIKFIFVEKLTSIMNRPIQRVAAIHDLSGFGKASLTVVIPILSTMGIQVCPLPTAVLSTHTRFQGFHLIDLTPHLQTIIDHWKELHLHFDAIYSGFLGSHQQIKIVKNFIDDFNTCLLYTSDAADDLLCVDLGGRRNIKKNNKTKKTKERTS